ncbi:MAG: gliding motility-associated C-terminal domain-containing protein, partial [Sphingobacteriales bacterium]
NSGAWSDIIGAVASTYINNVPANKPIGLYEYRLTVAEAGNISSSQCRISSLPISLTINANPVPTALNSGPVCKGSQTQLTATGGTQYTWSGPAGYTAAGASVTILNTGLSQAGNYSVLVSNAAGCNAIANTLLLVTPAPTIAVTFSDTSICVNDSILLSASGGSSYYWQPAMGLSASNVPTPKASPAKSTLYKVIGTNAAGCKDSATVNVMVNNKAIANAGPDKTIILGGSTVLSASIAGDYESFTWSPSPDIPNSSILQPTVAPIADATYRLNVISKNGCGSSTDEVNVNFYKGIFIPNAFTPNNDGLNDSWNVPALDAYPGFQLKVFDRYGQKVFENNNKNKPWDGRHKGQPLTMGVYIYVVKLNEQLPVLKGTVLIIR